MKAGILKGLYKVSNTQGTRVCYLIPHKGKEVRIVFDHSNNEFVTALNLNKHEQWKYNEKKHKQRKRNRRVDY